ncbi:hypothetical protein PCANC_16665 [Puccinia coronata f. sp. avenae]|uniref:Uncharacterized protein n=1 Tax=Puccinia coronata f. sp. avenae TaxID=200324 RepID=A0A2N5UEK7_9BASI|nr:hypothetical protein PCANC_16665 [Puccinia coronata f. sp. avenae]
MAKTAGQECIPQAEERFRRDYKFARLSAVKCTFPSPKRHPDARASPNRKANPPYLYPPLPTAFDKRGDHYREHSLAMNNLSCCLFFWFIVSLLLSNLVQSLQFYELQPTEDPISGETRLHWFGIVAATITKGESGNYRFENHLPIASFRITEQNSKNSQQNVWTDLKRHNAIHLSSIEDSKFEDGET